MHAARVAAFAVLGLLGPGRVGGADEGSPGQGLPLANDVRQRTDAYVKPLVESGLFSGAVLLARGGEVMVEAGYGLADVEGRIANAPPTQFKLMSVSKSLTAVAVMRLVQDGKVALEDRVAKHLSQWPEPWSAVTVHDLLDHTSGIPNLTGTWSWAPAMERGERGLVAWREIAGRFAREALESPPGARFSYSNFNYVLLGLVVEAASGRPYGETLKALVLDRAGMSKTTVDDGERHPGLSVGYFRGRGGAAEPSAQDMSRLLGAGGIASTVGDLYRLDRALRGEAVLSAATRSLMLTPRPAAGEHACGWMVSRVQNRLCVHHSGGANGYVADLLRFPDDDACVVVLSNYAFAPIGRVSADLASILFGKEVATPRTTSPAVLATCAGVYRDPANPRRTLVLRPSGNAILLFEADERQERCPGRLIVAVSDDEFLLPWSDERMRFAAAAEGREARLVLGASTFERIAPPVDAWRSASGRYRTEPPSTGLTILSDESGSLTFTDPGSVSSGQVFPLTDALALLLTGEDNGTLLHLEPGADRVVRLRWQRGEGRMAVGTLERATVPVDVAICGPAAPFEVLVLATVHAPWQFRSPRFTPAHVRAALALANPDVVGVESPPEWFQKGRFHEVTYEAQGIAVPFARARKIPVVGIDWQDLPAREQREADEEAQRSAQLTASLSGGGVLPLGAYGRLPATAIPSTLSFFRDPQFDFDLVNDVGADGHAKPALGGEDPAAPGFGGRRNREIAGRAIRAMEGCGGKRLVLVIGAGHKTVLDALLSRIPGVRVLRWGKDVPAPTPEDVDRAWTSEDLLAVLGHNLDGERSYFHPELIDFPRMHAILARLAKAGGNEEAAAYFQARLLTAEATLVKAPAEDGRFQDARRILSTLAESPAGKKKDSAILYPFPMDHWRMRYALEQAVRLERARLNLSAADAREQAAARKDLQALVVERRAAEKPLARREDALKDPGFEGDGLAVGPVFGWYCDDARPGGRVRAAPDESVKAEGRRALRLDVLPGEGLGFVSVSQCIAIPDERAGKPWDFSLRLRGERVTSVTLVAYRLEDGGRRAVEIARGPSVGVGSSWAGANLTIALPKDVSLLMVACVLVAPPGARLWLDDASPLQTTVTRPTVPDLLAREFGRTLLAPPP